MMELELQPNIQYISKLHNRNYVFYVGFQEHQTLPFRNYFQHNSNELGS